MGIFSRIVQAAVGAAARANKNEFLLLGHKIAPIGSFSILTLFGFFNNKRSAIVAPPPDVQVTIATHKETRDKLSKFLSGFNGS